jgi:IS5 family transposase
VVALAGGIGAPLPERLFNHKKARYRGLAKNGAQYDTLFALGNLVIAKKALLQSMENSVCEAA